MKKWTNEEVSALSASVAELGHSKGIRAFVNSPENTEGRTFNGCEYMLQKQRKINVTSNEPDGTYPVDATLEAKEDANRDGKKLSLVQRIFGWLFK